MNLDLTINETCRTCPVAHHQEGITHPRLVFIEVESAVVVSHIGLIHLRL